MASLSRSRSAEASGVIGLYFAMVSRLRRWREESETLRDVAYLDDRSLRSMGIEPTQYLREARVMRKFPFD